ncbi:hypothetical protein GPECTOR_17g819 [Gonium pectorale]|uniref:Centrosomal protein of 162 kDa n=1 Tax=Gonium pectorale TaxID=33097 RepID=A0A150GK65_GONPE|nr:hypothetical protein GPECTOR_17g819 [Gonium pectorale]|eukprot:KXZ50182.1 hypothetical protein GPECTOR_17g819 [Gonium pectorale]
MASARYSSPGNSGYDDDFELDGDDVEGELELDRDVAAGGLDLGDADEPDASTPPAGARYEDSPLSPPPPLPPLNLTVSPYLPRTGAAHAIAPPFPPRPSVPNPVPEPIAAAPPVPHTAPRPTSAHGDARSALGHTEAPAFRSAPFQPAPQLSQYHPVHQSASSPAPSVAAAPSSIAAVTPSATADVVPALSLALLQQASSAGAGAQQQQLAAAIRHSVDVMRASEQVRQLQAAVEGLTSQLLTAERGRAAAEAALVELTQRMQEQEKRLNDVWEAKLLEKQRELQQLRTKVQQLEAQGIKGRLTAASSSNPRGSQGGTGVGGPSISPDEAAALRKELLQTELLIRGYQTENEAATRRIKELEESLAAVEARAAEEALRSERAALLARDDAGRRNAETATKLSRVLALEKELAGVREEAQIRESELKAQLEKLRAEKKALEAKAGGVDLKAMADGDVLVKQLREEMEASRQATQATIEEMQSKLSWYAENQEMLNKNDALVAEQRDIIQQLQARLAQYEGAGAKGGPAATRAAAAQARVRELEAQVDQLHKTLRGRAPANSLAAVVAAARPSAEESALVAELQERVEELEEQLRNKDEEFELQLRTYQQQFEKLKAQYSERAGRLEAATKARGRVKDLERQLEEQKGIFGRRVRELEAKLRAAQEHGAAIPPTPAALALPHASGGPPSAAQTPTKGSNAQPHAPGSAAARRDDLVPASLLRAKELEFKKLQAELERRSKQVSELHLKLGEAESKIVRLTAELRRSHAAAAAGQSPLPSRTRTHNGMPHDERPVGPSRGPGASQPDSYPPDGSLGGLEGSEGSRQVSADLLERLEERCGNLTVENGSLRGQVAALSRQLAALRHELEEARAVQDSLPAAPPSSAAMAAEVAELRRKLDAAELALVTVQRSAHEVVERGAMAASDHQRSMLRLHDEVAYKEGLKWQERLATLEQELRTAQQRCEQLEAELAVARSRGAGSWTPEASAFAAMERRLDEMAREMATREAKWRAVLKDTQSLHGVQSDMERRKWEAALAAKEAEVRATRTELQALLDEVAAVQELQTRAAAKQRQRQQVQQ